MYQYRFVSECFDIDAISLTWIGNFSKCCIPPADCLHPLLPPDESNPCGLRNSRDHNFQLPVCNFNFRRNSFIICSHYRRRKILIAFFCTFSWLSARIFSYACSIFYFTFSTIAILTTSTFVTCFTINTQYSSQQQLHWLSVKWRIRHKLTTFIHRILSSSTASYIYQTFSQLQYAPSGLLRSTPANILTVPWI